MGSSLPPPFHFRVYERDMKEGRGGSLKRAISFLVLRQSQGQVKFKFHFTRLPFLHFQEHC